MNKKLVIGGIVLLLVVGGGAFLLLSKTETKSDLGESDTIPTQWSQAGDYEIKEVPGQQTVVTNSKAGFSFKVPAGWRVERDNSIPYILNLFSQDVEFDESQSIMNGCGVFLTTLQQPDEFEYLNQLIRSTTQESLGTVNKQVNIQRSVINLDGHTSLRTSIFTSKESDTLKSILVEVPFGEDGIVNLESSFAASSKSSCLENFQEVINTLLFR